MGTSGHILGDGTHTMIQPVLKSAEVSFSGADQVRILLATVIHQATKVRAQTHLPEATLAMDLDRECALEVFRKIGSLAKKMGWPLPPII